MKPMGAAVKEPLPPPVYSWLTARRAFAFLACYFLLQAVLRTLVSDSAELDESEQLLLTQDWRWGYGSDPPLYTWLQILVFQAFGTGIFGLALLKNVLLFGGFLFTYLSAKELTGDEQLSVVAMFSLLFFPQITWESQRDLTHSVLATVLASASFLMAARVVRRRRPWDYLLLGAVVGLGTLSKYSYCVFALALGVAGLSLSATRTSVLNRWMLLSLALFFVLTGPHFHWLLQNPELAWRRPVELVHDTAASFLRARLLGVFSVAKCAVLLSAALGFAYWIAFSRPGQPASPCEVPWFVGWIVRTMLVIVIMCLAVTLVTGIELRDRWFQPIVFLIALAAAWLVRHRLTLRNQERFVTLVGLIVLIVLLVLPGIPLSASVTHRPTRLNAPYSSLGRQLRASMPESAPIVAANRLVGGNLRLQFPHHQIVSPEWTGLLVSTNVPWMVVWDATKSSAPRPDLVKLVTASRGIDITRIEPGFVEAPCKYTQARTMKLGWLILPN